MNGNRLNKRNRLILYLCIRILITIENVQTRAAVLVRIDPGDRADSAVHLPGPLLHDLLLAVRLDEELDQRGSDCYTDCHPGHRVGCFRAVDLRAGAEPNIQVHFLLRIRVLRGFRQFHPHRHHVLPAAAVQHPRGVRGQGVHQPHPGAGRIENEDQVAKHGPVLQHLPVADEPVMHDFEMQAPVPRELPVGLGLHQAGVPQLQKTNILI